jgi:DNA-binding NtrC family response regulator
LDGNKMKMPQETRNLARLLLAQQTKADDTSETTESAAVRVCEKLRQPVCAFAGPAGYRALLSRALALARAEAPGLSILLTGPSGTGKSVLATQFIAEGIRQGEPGIVAVFEERLRCTDSHATFSASPMSSLTSLFPKQHRFPEHYCSDGFIPTR